MDLLADWWVQSRRISVVAEEKKIRKLLDLKELRSEGISKISQHCQKLNFLNANFFAFLNSQFGIQALFLLSVLLLYNALSFISNSIRLFLALLQLGDRFFY